jgi:sugar (pentulose or hexulose) kinase
VAIAIDAGTSGARAAAVDMGGRVIAQARRPYPISTPRPGWAEQDPDHWVDKAIESLGALVHHLGSTRTVMAIGLTGQCPTVAPFDKRGRPVGPGMMYRDNRAVAEAAQMRKRVGARHMHKLTGHVAEAFHVGPKVLWLRHHAPDVFATTAKFLQPRDAVLRKLVGVELTDETHANATLFYDLRRRCWSDELLAAFDLRQSVFPEALPAWSVAGRLSSHLARDLGLARIPVVVGAADSQCAAFGAGVTFPGPVSEMAGASTCINSTIVQPVRDIAVTHYSHAVPGVYCTEVGLNTAGAALEWGRQRLGFTSHTVLETKAAAFRARWRRSPQPVEAREQAPLFLPYLGDGERVDPTIRAAFVGLSARDDSASLAYSVVEGVALGVHNIIAVLQRSGCAVDELRCSGGGARHRLLAQLKADLLGVPVLQLQDDATAVGCALLAASAAGLGEEVESAVGAVLGRAVRVDPDPWGMELMRARADWFGEVLPSPAIRNAVERS